MEDKDDVVCHAFLGNKDLLLTIDNEVTTLIILALAGFFDNGGLCQVVEVAEL